jgi:hypothetical protein
MIAGLVVAALVAALVTRAAALRRYSYWFAHDLIGDASVHFVIVRHLRRSPASRYIEQFLIAGEPMSYPTGFHRLAALLPVATVRRRPWLPSLVLWTLSAPLFALYAWHLEGGLPGPGPSGPWVALALLLVSTSSLVFRGPAIAYLGLSERLLARVSCAAAFAFLLGDVQFGDGWGLPAAIGAGALAILSSIFARQALLFSLPVLALVWWDLRPLLSLAGMWVLAFALSPRHLYDSMRHTLEQWRIYARRVKGNRSHRSTMSSLVTPARIWRNRHVRDPRTMARAVLQLEPTRTLLLLPEIPIVFVLCWLTPAHTLLSRGWLGPVLAAAAIYAVTATEWGNHLGEAHRYLEYELLFVVPLLGGLAVRMLSAAAATAALALYATTVAGVVALYWVVVPRHERQSMGTRLNAFLDRLALPHGAVVFPVPMYLAADICARREDCRSFWWQPGYMADSIYDEFFEEYPFLKRDYRGLFDRYGVTHVVCDETQLHDVAWRYDFGGLEPLLSDGVFSAYRVPGRPGPAAAAASAAPAVDEAVTS